MPTNTRLKGRYILRAVPPSGEHDLRWEGRRRRAYGDRRLLRKADGECIHIDIDLPFSLSLSLSLSPRRSSLFSHLTRSPTHSTLLYSTLLYSTLLYSALLCSTLLYSPLLSSTLLYTTLLYSTLLYSTLRSSTLPYSTLLCSILFHSRAALFDWPNFLYTIDKPCYAQEELDFQSGYGDIARWTKNVDVFSRAFLFVP